MTVHRLSPKNQVTIPRDARVFAGGAGATVGHLRGSRVVVRKPDTKELFNTVMLLTESELQRREDQIRNNAAYDVDKRAQAIAKLNDDMKAMPIDAQNRIVLPAEFVAFLGIGDAREIKFICSNTAIQAWNPEHYAAYADLSAQPAYDPQLAAVLSL
jgi:DNA-binding transcriptional regulator/RsmH inhibitor MraZ